MNNNALNAANGGYDGGGGMNDSSGGLLSAICAAFCKDTSLADQFNMNETNNNPNQVPITSQST